MDSKLKDRCVNCSLSFKGDNENQKSIKFERYFADNPTSKTLSTVDIKIPDALAYIHRMTRQQFASYFIEAKQDEVSAESFVISDNKESQELPTLAVCLRCKLLLAKMYNCLLKFDHLTEKDSVLRRVINAMNTRDYKHVNEESSFHVCESTEITSAAKDKSSISGDGIKEEVQDPCQEKDVNSISVCFEQIMKTEDEKFAFEVFNCDPIDPNPEEYYSSEINMLNVANVTEVEQIEEYLPSAEQIMDACTAGDNPNPYVQHSDEEENQDKTTLARGITCLKCDDKFMTAATYLQHDHCSKIAHKVSVRNCLYYCQYCKIKKGYEYYQEFRMHTIKKHLREPIVVCGLCKKYYGCEKTLEKHKLNKHSTVVEMEVPLTEKVEPVALMQVENRSACEKENSMLDNTSCENFEHPPVRLSNQLISKPTLPARKKPKQKRKMYRYVAEMTEPYKCKLCAKCVPTERGIKIHLKKMHKKINQKVKSATVNK